MNAATEHLILNLIAAFCTIIIFLVLKYGFYAAYRDLKKHIKRHFSG